MVQSNTSLVCYFSSSSREQIDPPSWSFKSPTPNPSTRISISAIAVNADEPQRNHEQWHRKDDDVPDNDTGGGQHNYTFGNIMWNRIAISAARGTSAAARMSIGGARPAAPGLRAFSSGYGENITYSGGQASEGQGGFYGSGGARLSKLETEHRPEMVALAADVENLTMGMEEIGKLDAMLEEEKEKTGSSVTGKSLEISSKIKKVMTSVDVMDCLNRLEVEGEPVWGLSSEERDLVHIARQKVNQC